MMDLQAEIVNVLVPSMKMHWALGAFIVSVIVAMGPVLVSSLMRVHPNEVPSLLVFRAMALVVCTGCMFHMVMTMVDTTRASVAAEAIAQGNATFVGEGKTVFIVSKKLASDSNQEDASGPSPKILFTCSVEKRDTIEALVAALAPIAQSDPEDRR